jgi:diguanylate cyclase (GGDEF)-like protein
MLLLFCELERLKEINNTLGHREGDLALVRMADALERAFRDSDILARLAGDEFVIFAPEASDQAGEAMLRRLRNSLEEISISDRLSTFSQCRCSPI